MTLLLEIVISLLILFGSFFTLVSSIGLIRLPEFFTRLHAPTKASTLGIGAVLVAAILAPIMMGGRPGFAELLLTLFVFVSSPVVANMLSMAALRATGSEGGNPSGHEDRGVTGHETRRVSGHTEPGP